MTHKSTPIDSLLSKCHQAPVKLAGGLGDFRDDDRAVTMHYECTKCGEACDLYAPIQEAEWVEELLIIMGAVYAAGAIDSMNAHPEKLELDSIPKDSRVQNGVKQLTKLISDLVIEGQIEELKLQAKNGDESSMFFNIIMPHDKLVDRIKELKSKLGGE
jgi:hypothetical protein